MQRIPHTEAASYADNDEGGAKSGTFAVPADHLERPRVQLYEICSADSRAASLAGVNAEYSAHRSGTFRG